jgi:hypothetical protein
MDLRRHSKYFGDIWRLFGVLFSVCVFVGIPKRDEYLAFYYATNKKKEYIHKNKKVVILYAYPCIPKKSSFRQNKYT